MRNAVANAIIQKASEDKNLFLVAGDAGLGLWDKFKEEACDQYLNPGINEACSIGMCAGLALAGKRAIYYNIAPFVLMRPYEQVRNDICYQELPVILVGIGSGLTYAPSGMTHYAIEDIALGMTMSNLDIFSPADSGEAVAAFEYAYRSNKPSYIRIPKNGDPIFNVNQNVNMENFQLIKDNGNKILIITHSNIIKNVIEVADTIQASVATSPFINSFNDTKNKFLEQYENIFVVEEHFEFGGLGSFIERYTNKIIHKIGIKNHFIHEIGSQSFLRTQFGLDVEGIRAKIQKIVH